MLICKKGQNMENKEFEHESCECCHCKKIFMLLVLMILSFIAGIMVGNCSTKAPYDYYHYNHHFMHHPYAMAKQKNASNSIKPSLDNEMGDLVIEVTPDK